MVKMLPSQKGIVLIAVIVFILILTIIGAAFLKLAGSEGVLTHRERHVSQALYLADAGAEHAIANLLDGTDDDIAETTLGGGTYAVTITGSNPYTVRSTGRFGTPQVAKTVEIVWQTKSIFQYAVFGDEGVDLRSNAYTDSYDSQIGGYGELVGSETNVGSDGDVGTNDTTIVAPYSIHLNSNVEIDGDVVIGPNGDPDQAVVLEGSATISGTQSAASSEQELPENTAPTGLTDRGSLSIGGAESQTISSSGQYSSLTLDTTAVLTLDGNLTIYVTGAFSLLSNSAIDITSGSEVTIYVGGSFSLDSNTQINNLTQDPTKFMIYGTNSLTNATWDSNSVFYGGFYAPNANVVINSNANIYGSVIANMVTLDSNATVHYDHALASRGPTAGYEVVSWEEEPAVW